MALRMSPVSRNLNRSVLIFNLELMDLLLVMGLAAAGMLSGQFFFSDSYLGPLPMNFALGLMVPAIALPALTMLKYGKPRGYLESLINWYMKPRAYSSLERDSIQTKPYLR